MKGRLPRLLVSVTLALSLALPASALTNPIQTLQGCSGLSASKYGLFATDVDMLKSPQELCAAIEPTMMDLSTIPTSDCFSKDEDMMDTCRYFAGWLRATIASTQILMEMKAKGEVQRLIDSGQSPDGYKDYMDAAYRMIRAAGEAFTAANASKEAFHTRMQQTRCGDNATQECVDQLNKEIDLFAAAYGEGTIPIDQYTNAMAEISGDLDHPSGFTTADKLDALKQASEKAEGASTAVTSAWNKIREIVNTLAPVDKGNVVTPAGPPKNSAFNLDPRLIGSVIGLNLPLGTVSVPQVIAKVIRQLLSIVGALALAFFVWGGIQIMLGSGGMSGSGADAKKINAGKKTIAAALAGLIAVFASYAILSLIINAISKS